MLGGVPTLRRGLIAANLAAAGVLWVVALPMLGPTAVDRAVDDVERRVAYVNRAVPGQSVAYLQALAVNSYVVGHVSAPAYGYLKEFTDGQLPSGDDNAEIAEAALEAGAGICGQAAATAMTLYQALGLPARQLIVSYPGNGHTTVEVQYDGAWHWFDPTFGYFYRAPDAAPSDVASLVDVLGMSGQERERSYVGNDSLLWAQMVRAAGTGAGAGLDVVELPDLRVELVDGTVIYER
jgi:hypothetical protein